MGACPSRPPPSRAGSGTYAAPSEPRAKYLPRQLPRKPALSDRKKGVRLAIVAALREHGQRWRMSERDFAAVAELCKSVVDGMLDADRPVHVESLLLLPDARALEIIDALRDIVRDRRSAHR